MNKERNIFWDVVKGVAIIAVILIHTTQKWTIVGSIRQNCVNFAVPIFMFMAGYFCHCDGDMKSFLLKKAKRIIVPLIIFSLVYAVYDLYYWNHHGTTINANSILMALINFPLGWGYFVLALFQLFCLYPFISQKNVRWLSGFSLICILIAFSYYICGEVFFRELNLCRRMMPSVLFLPWMPMFALGVVIRRIQGSIQLKWALLGSVGFLMLAIIEGIVYLHLNIHGLSFTPLKLGSYGFAFCLALTLFCVEKQKGYSYLSNCLARRLAELGRYSFFVYLSHRGVLIVLASMHNYLPMNSIVFKPIAVIVIEYMLVRALMALPDTIRKSLWFVGV